jgi:hypothetical protein
VRWSKVERNKTYTSFHPIRAYSISRAAIGGVKLSIEYVGIHLVATDAGVEANIIQL